VTGKQLMYELIRAPSAGLETGYLKTILCLTVHLFTWQCYHCHTEER